VQLLLDRAKAVLEQCYLEALEAEQQDQYGADDMGEELEGWQK
jgi:hypothetical protein